MAKDKDKFQDKSQDKFRDEPSTSSPPSNPATQPGATNQPGPTTPPEESKPGAPGNLQEPPDQDAPHLTTPHPSTGKAPDKGPAALKDRQDAKSDELKAAEDARKVRDEENKRLQEEYTKLDAEIRQQEANSLQAKRARKEAVQRRLNELHGQFVSDQAHAQVDEAARRRRALLSASTDQIEQALGELRKEQLSMCSEEELLAALQERRRVGHNH